MVKEKIRFLIIFSKNQQLKQISQSIRKIILDSKQSITLKSIETAKTTIPEILSANVILFGFTQEWSVSKDYQEILRAFTGINLAGRIAACFMLFSDKNNEDEQKFRKMLEETEIDIYQPTLIVQLDKNKDRDIKSWCKFFVSHCKTKQKNSIKL